MTVKNRGIIGNKRAISTSKIKKMTVIKKKWREKGIRDDEIGSKPHSKGEDFSRSEKDFFDRIRDIIIIKLAIIKFRVKIFIKMLIIYINEN